MANFVTIFGNAVQHFRGIYFFLCLWSKKKKKVLFDLEYFCFGVSHIKTRIKFLEKAFASLLGVKINNTRLNLNWLPKELLRNLLVIAQAKAGFASIV